MELIRGVHNLRARHWGCVATIGNFDGIHLGHQAVLNQLAAHGSRLHLPCMVISFEPLPREFFLGGEAPVRLSRFRDKVQALNQYTVDRLLCLRFNRTLAAMSAEDFIKQLLVAKLGVKHLVVGDDFRFAYKRSGDFQTLVAAGKRYGFTTESMQTFDFKGYRVSSSRIREAIIQGDMYAAEQLLGRRYRISGRVMHGDKLGRAIGFPTLNLRLGSPRLAAQGVYAVEVHGIEKQPLYGVANAGNRPTVDGLKSNFEVHLLDFSGDLYGSHVAVDLLYRIREERRFNSITELKAQIAKDVAAAYHQLMQR